MGLGHALRNDRFRGKARLISRFVPDTGTMETEIFGVSMRLDLANYVDRMIYAGCYEPINVYRFQRHLSPGDCVVDVGANIGFFSYLASSLVGHAGRVLAIEPHPTNFAILEPTIRANGLQQVEPLAIGLGEEAGEGVVEMRDQKEFPNRTASMIPGSGEVKSKVRQLMPKIGSPANLLVFLLGSAGFYWRGPILCIS